jgi:DNA-binding CsgD family transcriptional regulator
VDLPGRYYCGTMARGRNRHAPPPGHATPPVAFDVPSAPGSEICVGPVAEDGSLRVIRFRIGGDEFALLSFANDEHHACSLRDGEGRPRQDARLNLTAAERLIVELVVSGLSNRAIAERRGTSVSTIANQLASIYKKLGLASRAELTLWHLNGPFPSNPQHRE